MPMRRVIARLTSAATLALMCSAVPAAYPEKTIEIFYPFPPGNDTDAAGRLLAQSIGKRLGVTVQLLNKPGGAGVVGTSDFVKVKPDGYTIGLLPMGPALTQIIAGATPYARTALVPISPFMDTPFVIAARGNAPFKTMKELAAYAKSGKSVVLGGYSPAAAPTLVMHRIAQADGWNFKVVAFPNPNSATLTAGDADIVTTGGQMIAGQVKAGDVRPLVAMAPKRLSNYPDLPTVAEAGYNVDAAIWSGLFAPAGTPRDIIDRLNVAIREAMAEPALQDYAQKTGAMFRHETPETFEAQIRAAEGWIRPLMESLGLVKK